MSRIGKKPIIIPGDATVKYEGKILSVSGPKGTLEFIPCSGVEVKIIGDRIQVTSGSAKTARALQGTTRQVIANMLEGVTAGWSKTLEIIGTGYRVNPEGEKLVFSLGYSHKIEIEPPKGISFSVAENKVTVIGTDKALVGEMAAKIRRLRLPDAYKGKGVRYLGERVRLKPGKATKVGSSVGGGK